MNELQEYGIEYLYHMTHINNLSSIVRNGLLSHNKAHERGSIKVEDISNRDVQDIRASKKIDNIPLHEYVPLYFAPRNPMLFAKREIQEDIVILGIDPKLLTEPNVIFCDGNATSQGTQFYEGIQMLNQLSWEIIRAKY